MRLYKFIVILLSFIITPFFLFAQGRERWQDPEAIMDSAGIKPGKIIGEIGAGDGYFTFKMRNRIGPQGHIFANDIVQSELDKIDRECRRENIHNITTVLGKNDDPLLPKDTLDVVIMVYAFHHIENPVLFLNNLRKRLKPGTPVVIVERDPEKYGQEYTHFYKKDKMLRLTGEADYKLIKLFTFLARDNIYVLKP